MESQELSYRSAVSTASNVGRNVVGRPPSASAFSNRIHSASTSRVSSTSGVTSAYGQLQGRLGTGLPPATQVNVLDRPITQQGIAGLRPGTNRGLPMTRQGYLEIRIKL